MEKSKGPGGCFKFALVAAGFDCTGLDIPEWIAHAEKQEICEDLGLELLPNGPASLNSDRWYIVTVALDEPTEAHAQLMAGDRVPPNVLGLIPLPPETVITEDLVQARLARAGLARRVNWF